MGETTRFSLAEAHLHKRNQNQCNLRYCRDDPLVSGGRLLESFIISNIAPRTLTEFFVSSLFQDAEHVPVSRDSSGSESNRMDSSF